MDLLLLDDLSDRLLGWQWRVFLWTLVACRDEALQLGKKGCYLCACFLLVAVERDELADLSKIKLFFIKFNNKNISELVWILNWIVYYTLDNLS